MDKSKLTHLVYFYCFGQVLVILLSLGKALGREKQSKTSPFDNPNPVRLASLVKNK